MDFLQPFSCYNFCFSFQIAGLQWEVDCVPLEIQVFIKQRHYPKFSLDVHPFSDVIIVKELIDEETGYAVYIQRLKFQDEVLENEQNLTSYGIVDESILHLSLK